MRKDTNRPQHVTILIVIMSSLLSIRTAIVVGEPGARLDATKYALRGIRTTELTTSSSD